MTITKYTTEPVDGPESDVEYDTYEDAAKVAQRDGLQVIARHYVFNDSELVEDFTRYHWLLTARFEDDSNDPDDLYRPGGLDSCHGSVDEAIDNLVERLSRVMRDLDEREDDYESVRGAIRDLAGVDPDGVEENGYSCMVEADPEEPVVYRITRILFSNCDEHNLR